MENGAPEIGTDMVQAEPTAVAETSTSAVAAREKAAVEARFVMAMNRPRNEETARLKILKQCENPEFAESARYRKPIGGKSITGLSVRFAEEIARLWGNVFVQASIVFDDRERRIYHCVATDLETNTAHEQDVVVEKFVERKKVKAGDEVINTRLNSYGEQIYLKVATEDEVLTKANAGLSKAKRNLILTLIPAHIREAAEKRAIKTLKDADAQDPEAARRQILDAFFELGVMPEQVQELIGKPLEQLNPAELQWLRSIYTGLREGEATWQEVMDEHTAKTQRAERAREAANGKTADLKQKVKKAAKKKATNKKSSDLPPPIADAESKPQKPKTEEELEREAIQNEDDEEKRVRQEEQQELGQ